LFFQAEDGILDRNVTGVQTCALSIYNKLNKILCKQHVREGCYKVMRKTILWLIVVLVMGVIFLSSHEPAAASRQDSLFITEKVKIGRASCRERVEIVV